ncbi:MAG TPA: hypothetical protein DEA55_05280 [Rhodospirillaceae bacterium]|nr:hypothetical protein [Rhodospirillaceae bacterium]
MVGPEEQQLIPREESIEDLKAHFAREGIHFGTTIDPESVRKPIVHYELIEDPLDALKMGLMNIEKQLQKTREGFAAELLSNVTSAATVLYYSGKFALEIVSNGSVSADSLGQMQSLMALGSTICGSVVAGTIWKDLQREQVRFDDLLTILYTYEQSPRGVQDYARLIKNIHDLTFELEALEKIDPDDFDHKKYMDSAKTRAEEEKNFRHRLEKVGYNLRAINPVKFGSLEYWKRETRIFNERLSLTKRIISNTFDTIKGYISLGSEFSNLLRAYAKAAENIATLNDRRPEMKGYIRFSKQYKKEHRDKSRSYIPKAAYATLSPSEEADHINFEKGEAVRRTRWKAAMMHLEMWFCFFEGTQGITRLGMSGYEALLSLKDDVGNLASALSNAGQGISHVFSGAAGARAIDELCDAFSDEFEKIDSIRSLEAKEMALINENERAAKRQAMRDLQILLIQRKIKGRQSPTSSQSGERPENDGP